MATWGLAGAAAAFTSSPCCPVEAGVPSEQVPSSSNEHVKALLGRFLRDTCPSHCFRLLTTAVGAELGRVSGGAGSSPRGFSAGETLRPWDGRGVSTGSAWCSDSRGDSAQTLGGAGLGGAGALSPPAG